MRRRVLLPLLLSLAAACAQRKPPPAPVRSAPPVVLPAAFEGSLPGAERVRLLLPDPARYRLAIEARGAIHFEEGSWQREGDRILLHGAAPETWTLANGALVADLGPEQLARDQEWRLRPSGLPSHAAGTVERDGDEWWLRPCDGGAALRLLDGSGSLGDLLDQVAGEPFAELLVAPARDASIVWEVLRVAADGAGCGEWRQAPRIAGAAGEEPAWRLEIDERSVRLHREGRRPIGSPWAPFRWEEGAWSYRADTGTERWEIALRPSRCRVDSLPAAFGYRAEVRIDGERLEGCAWLGPDWHRLGSAQR